MRSSQLKSLARYHSSYLSFKHVEICAVNELPHRYYISDCPCFIFVNTEPNFRDGEHWTCIYIYRDLNDIYGYFYDSFGESPSSYSNRIVQFLKNTTCSYLFNSHSHQPPNSDLCAYYCLYMFFSLHNIYRNPLNINAKMVQESEDNIVKLTLLTCELICIT